MAAPVAVGYSKKSGPLGKTVYLYFFYRELKVRVETLKGLEVDACGINRIWTAFPVKYHFRLEGSCSLRMLSSWIKSNN